MCATESEGKDSQMLDMGSGWSSGGVYFSAVQMHFSDAWCVHKM